MLKPIVFILNSKLFNVALEKGCSLSWVQLLVEQTKDFFRKQIGSVYVRILTTYDLKYMSNIRIVFPKRLEYISPTGVAKVRHFDWFDTLHRFIKRLVQSVKGSTELILR